MVYVIIIDVKVTMLQLKCYTVLCHFEDTVVCDPYTQLISVFPYNVVGKVDKSTIVFTISWR